MKRAIRRGLLAVVLWALSGLACAQNTAYDLGTRVLTLAHVTLGSTVFNNVAVRLDAFAVLSVGGTSMVAASAAALTQTSTYDPGTRVLTMPAIAVGDTVYLNTVVRLDSMAVLSVGSTAPVSGSSGDTGGTSSGGSTGTATYRLTINVNGTGQGLVYWANYSPQLGVQTFSCRNTCTVTIPANIYVQLQGQADNALEWPFETDPVWGGDCPNAGVHQSCVVQMTGNKTVNVALHGPLAGAYNVYFSATQANRDGTTTRIPAFQQFQVNLTHDDANRVYQTDLGPTVGNLGGISFTLDGFAAGAGPCGFEGTIAHDAAITAETYLVGYTADTPPVRTVAPTPADGNYVHGRGVFSCTGGTTASGVTGNWSAYRTGPAGTGTSPSGTAVPITPGNYSLQHSGLCLNYTASSQFDVSGTMSITADGSRSFNGTYTDARFFPGGTAVAGTVLDDGSLLLTSGPSGLTSGMRFVTQNGQMRFEGSWWYTTGASANPYLACAYL